jgi:lipid-A-disaccharide synthase
MTSRHVMLVAGEASGDALGAELMLALRQAAGPLRFSGVGGAAMAEAGLTSLFPMRELSVMGLAEVLPRARGLLRRIADVAAHASATRPDVVVTIDSPGFNFRLAKRLQLSELPLVHYVAPQVWAWRPGRAARVAALFDHMLALLPFEPELFSAHGLPCSFVGHPATERLLEPGEAAGLRRAHGLAEAAPLLLLLPGSRAAEVGRLLPVLLEAARQMRQQLADLRAIVIAAPPVEELLRQRLVAERPSSILLPAAKRRDAFAAVAQGWGVALAASGTATLELALAGVPTVVTYRAHPLTALIARRLIRLSHVGLPNILLNQGVLPELLQGECRAERLTATGLDLLKRPEAAQMQREATRRLWAMLRPPGPPPSVRAATAVLEVMRTGRRTRPGSPR